MKKVESVDCPHCKRSNALSTGDECTHCGERLGLFAKLVTAFADDDGSPQAGWGRELSRDEVRKLSAEPWILFGLRPKYVIDHTAPRRPDGSVRIKPA